MNVSIRELPWKRGAVAGVVAYILVYILVVLLRLVSWTMVESSPNVTSIRLFLVLQRVYIYPAHYVPLRVLRSSMEFGLWPPIPLDSIFLLSIPVVVLVALGYYVSYTNQSSLSPLESASVGVPLTVGYLPVFVGAGLVYRHLEETWSPMITMRLFQMPAVYAVLFGGLGGVLAYIHRGFGEDSDGNI